MNEIKCISEEMLNDAQKKCLDEVTSIVTEGEYNATVLTTPGWGSNTLSYILAERLKGLSVVFVAAAWEARMIERHLSARGLDAQCVSLAQLEEKSEKIKNAELLILHNMKFAFRRRIEPYIEDQTVISFATAYQTLEGDENAELEESFALKGSQVLLYRTQCLFDVRDVFFASFTEKQFLDNQFLRYRLEATELMAKMLAIKNLRDSQKIGKLKEENQRSVQEIVSLKEESLKSAKEIERLKSTVDFQNMMLTCMGMDPAAIKHYLDEMMKQKERITALTCSEEEKEAVISDAQSVISELLREIKEKYAGGLAASTCEGAIRQCINKDVWQRLDEKTRSYLITAKYTFESLLKQEETMSMDYSGVCLLLTKSVELESRKRFFDGYGQYLYKKYQNNYNSWPQSMVFYDKKSRALKQNNVYTLGALSSIVKSSGKSFSDEFLDYAGAELYSKMTRSDIKAELKRNCDFIEYIRVQYRNPSAHTGSFKHIGAKQCFEYIIEVHKMLQRMILKMDY